jgi:hypothetical protein
MRSDEKVRELRSGCAVRASVQPPSRAFALIDRNHLVDLARAIVLKMLAQSIRPSFA